MARVKLNYGISWFHNRKPPPSACTHSSHTPMPVHRKQHCANNLGDYSKKVCYVSCHLFWILKKFRAETPTWTHHHARVPASFHRMLLWVHSNRPHNYRWTWDWKCPAREWQWRESVWCWGLGWRRSHLFWDPSKCLLVQGWRDPILPIEQMWGDIRK